MRRFGPHSGHWKALLQPRASHMSAMHKQSSKHVCLKGHATGNQSIWLLSAIDWGLAIDFTGKVGLAIRLLVLYAKRTSAPSGRALRTW